MSTPAVQCLAQQHQANTGAWSLVLDKYCWSDTGILPDDNKTQVLKGVVDAYSRGRNHLLARTKRERWEKLLPAGRHRLVRLRQEGKLMVALGRAHVLENVGLAFDRATGLPWIPGSAVKGVVSTWATWEAAGDGLFQDPPRLPKTRKEHPDQSLAAAILGDDNPEGSEDSGRVLFLGGFPVSLPDLDLEIVNPHHDTQGDPQKSLTPVTFLCLLPGMEWVFPLVVRAGEPNAEQLLDKAAAWLTEALTQNGIGAKTASGYGRFSTPNTPSTGTPGQPPSAQDPDAISEKEFNAILDRANNAGKMDLFRKDVDRLKKDCNAAWRAKLSEWLASHKGKDARKRLRGKDWFPQEWLPKQ